LVLTTYVAVAQILETGTNWERRMRTRVREQESALQYAMPVIPVMPVMRFVVLAMACLTSTTSAFALRTQTQQTQRRNLCGLQPLPLSLTKPQPLRSVHSLDLQLAQVPRLGMRLYGSTDTSDSEISKIKKTTEVQQILMGVQEAQQGVNLSALKDMSTVDDIVTVIALLPMVYTSISTSLSGNFEPNLYIACAFATLITAFAHLSLR
jgi:small basic protein